MATTLPLMPDELLSDFGALPDHAYYKEIKRFLSAGFIMDMAGRALMAVSERSSDINKATISTLEDYIEDLSNLSFALREEEQSNTIYSPD